MLIFQKLIILFCLKKVFVFIIVFIDADVCTYDAVFSSIKCVKCFGDIDCM